MVKIIHPDTLLDIMIMMIIRPLFKAITNDWLY